MITSEKDCKILHIVSNKEVLAPFLDLLEFFSSFFTPCSFSLSSFFLSCVSFSSCEKNEYKRKGGDVLRNSMPPYVLLDKLHTVAHRYAVGGKTRDFQRCRCIRMSHNAEICFSPIKKNPLEAFSRLDGAELCKKHCALRGNKRKKRERRIIALNHQQSFPIRRNTRSG